MPQLAVGISVPIDTIPSLGRRDPHSDAVPTNTDAVPTNSDTVTPHLNVAPKNTDTVLPNLRIA